MALPIGHGQTISQPLVVALMTEALEVGDRHKVLEIGTGSGYQAAVLARLCRRVFTIERHRAAAAARRRSASPSSASTTSPRASATAPRAGRSRRRSTASSSPPRRRSCPAALLDSLAEGGILVAPVGEERRDQQLVRIRREREGFVTEELGPVRFVPLVAGLPRESESTKSAGATGRRWSGPSALAPWLAP